MTANRRRKSQKWAKYRFKKFSTEELQTIAFVATLICAIIAMKLGIYDSVVWNFLFMALGLSMGRIAAGQKQNN